ncbi:rCG63222 [Rattus norvegicus]|uniref:RCG63222 n=1 Tax=Rattus norvegicus TaxID=10116 RepID=A6IZM1_RAT|nr:rCG63222 [Rattus norvegicus]
MPGPLLSGGGDHMMPGREVVTGERKPAPTPPTLGRDQSPGRSSPRMPGCLSVISWALSLALPGPVSPVKNAGVRAGEMAQRLRAPDCSSRGHELNSQQPHGGSQPSVKRSDSLFWCI